MHLHNVDVKHADVRRHTRDVNDGVSNILDVNGGFGTHCAVGLFGTSTLAVGRSHRRCGVSDVELCAGNVEFPSVYE